MRRAVAIAFVASLAFAGTAIAYPYSESTDTYTLTSSITPFHSGTVANPNPADVVFSYDVDTDPSGGRPGLTKGFKTVFQGMGENTPFFPACGTSTLGKSGPSGCPKGSQVGQGFMVLEEGPTAANDVSYDQYCSLDETLFNGGNHNMTLYITEGQGEGDYDPCTLPGDNPVIVNINLVHATLGGVPELGEQYSLPQAILHPDAQTDAAIIHEEWEIPQATSAVTETIKTKTKVTYYVIRTKITYKRVVTGKGKHKKHHRVKVIHRIKNKKTKVVIKKSRVTVHVGFLDTRYCAPNGQRQVSADFTNEDGTGRVRNQLVPCTR